MRLYASFALATFAALSAANVATFDDLSFNPNTPSYENGAHLSGQFTSGGLTFGNSYDASYDGFSGFAYSKVQNTTDPQYTNQFAAYTGAAYSGSNYGISDYDATISLPTGQRILGMEVTNTTYAALTMLNGDPYGFSKPFVAGDYFTLVATGYANGVATGTASFNLADYRFTDATKDYVVKSWTYFDLSALGAATSIRFSYDSNVTNAYGISVPEYFALDDVRTQAVPEPASVAALGLGAAAFVRRRKGGRK